MGRLREYLAEMRWSGYAEQSTATRLSGLSSALKVMSPSYDSKRVSRAAGRITASAPRTREVSLDRDGLRSMLNLSKRLMRSFDLREGPFLARAVDYRDGLILGLLLHRPLRISNLAGIEVGRHLVDTGSGFLLTFEGSEMKSHRSYECDVPARLVPALRRYIAHVRPIFLAEASPAVQIDALWLGVRGQPMQPDSVGHLIRRRTSSVLANGIGPHRLRHMAATLVAEDAPERVSDVSVILAHCDPRTTEQHYVHARASKAAEKLNEALSTLILKAR